VLTLKEKIKTFRKYALASTLSTYFLIFVGGLVRVSGAGLGCPDWPKCFGRWIPPLDKSQIPQDFHASSFNFTLAWIEYINRLIGMVVGILILITAILAIKNFRNYKNILIPSILAAFLVAFQGWYGSIVVSSHLQSITISVHLLLALTIVSLLIFLTQNSHHLELNQSNIKIARLGDVKLWVLLLWGVILFQIMIGTQVRSQIELILEKFPLLHGDEIFNRIGAINNFHMVLGTLLMLFSIVLASKVVKIQSDTLNLYTRLVLGLIITQMIIGLVLESAGLPQIMQVFHLWIASLIIGALLLLYVELSYLKKKN
jgi:cytochrome c oxidase assembly protein subunit 15